MINKTAAPRTSKYLQLQFLSAAISELNKHSEDKYMIVAEEVDTDPMIIDALFILRVQVFCNKVVIYTKERSFSKATNKEKLQKEVSYSFSPTVILNFIQSGIINYKMSTDALTENGAQLAPKMDRVSLIRTITRFPPNSPAGLSRGLSFAFEGDVAGQTGSWDFEKLLFETTYEMLIKLLNELNGNSASVGKV